MISALLRKHAQISYGFSERGDGSMHRRLEKEVRENYFSKIGIRPGRVVAADLVHGAKVASVGEEEAGKMIPDTDGLVTKIPGLFLSVTAADCFPVYLYDPKAKIAGIAHAGWKGLLGGIVPNFIAAAKEAGSGLSEALVCIGPGIRARHFEIQADLRPKFEEHPEHVSDRGLKIFVDLPGIIRTQLEKAGIPKENIEDSGICTYCDKKRYFSYRRDKPAELEVTAAYIGIK